MTIMAPIARGLTGLLGGGIGSFFGGGTGGVGGIGAELLGGGEFLGAKFAGGFASGGSIGSGKWGIVGERGPEIVKGPADVIPSSTGTSIHYAPVLDMRGASGITEGQVQNLLAQHFVVVKQTLPGLINDARTRRRI